MSAQREAFEAWAMNKRWFNAQKNELGIYISARTQAQCAGWLAAQAAMPPDPASRVPMTEAQMSVLTQYCRKGIAARMQSLIRAVEAHHGIGAKT